MAKRDYVNLQEIEKQAKSPDYKGTINVNAISEQEIVKPYLEKLKSKMKERDDDNGGEPLNAVDRGYHLAYEHLCKEIDNLLSEQEPKNEL